MKLNIFLVHKDHSPPYNRVHSLTHINDKVLYLYILALQLVLLGMVPANDNPYSMSPCLLSAIFTRSLKHSEMCLCLAVKYGVHVFVQYI